MVFGNQFIVTMGYLADRVGLQAACRFSANDWRDFKTMLNMMALVCMNVAL